MTQNAQINTAAAVGAVAVAWISLTQSPRSGWAFVVGAVLAASGLWLSFANALSLLLRGRVMVQIYRGTEMDTREEYMEHPTSKIACVFSPLSFSAIVLLALNVG